MSTGSLGLVVPLYNEEERLAEYGKLLVDFVTDQPAGSELLFVDDGSTDGTPHAVEELIDGVRGVRLLRLGHAGKGAAVSAGLRQVAGDHIGFCDLDLSTPLGDLQRIVHAATRAPVLAVGSRDLATSTLLQAEGPVRKSLGRAYNRLLQATVTPGIVDTQCGAKVAAREVWDAVLPHCRERGYAWDGEAIAVALALGIPVQEIPIRWRHDERSRVRILRDGSAMVWATGRIWRTARRAATSEHAAHGGEVFDAENAERLMEADADHWWFRSKAAFVSSALRRIGEAGTGWLVDIGAGAGGVTTLLGWDPEHLLVLEGNEALVRRARDAHGLDGVRAEISRLPLGSGSAEVVCLLDVIEHIDDPLPTLREAARVLAPSGLLVVNVPAHEWLWSPADEALGHARRYTRATLRADLAKAGFRPVLMTHVFSWLVPPVWLKRRVANPDQPELGLDQRSPVVDRAALVLTRLERAMLGRITLPFGTSVLCLAERA